MKMYENLSQAIGFLFATKYKLELSPYFRYNEILDYDYTTTKTKNPGKAIGHFTQVVWKDSVKVGCGIKIVQDGGTTTVYIVGRYLPGGNFVMLNMGEQYDDGRKRVYGENVLAASGGWISFILCF